ncbi:hypothetical protein D3C84_1070460 [compost metagenome]
MLAAIDLHGQQSLQAVKVEDIRPCGVLAAELQSCQLPSAQSAPNQVFGIGGRSPEHPGEFQAFIVERWFAHASSLRG